LSSIDEVERVRDLLKPDGGWILLRLGDDDRQGASGHQDSQYNQPFHGSTPF